MVPGADLNSDPLLHDVPVHEGHKVLGADFYVRLAGHDVRGWMDGLWKGFVSA